MSKGKITLVVALALVSLAFAQSWSFTFQIVPVPGDTFDLTMAMTAGATAGYDAFLDVPYFSPPDGKGAYFPLVDPLHPAYTKLQTDVRGIETGDYTYWVAMDEGYFGLDDRFVVWDTLEIPDPVSAGYFWVAPITYGIDPATLDDTLWVPMETTTEFVFGVMEDVAFRFMPSGMVDTIAPYVNGFDPVPGEAGVDVDLPIQFNVKDDNRGVDDASITVSIWWDGDSMGVDAGDMVLDPIVGGYRVTIDPAIAGGEWPDSTMITYSVNACDLADPANCMVADTVVSFFTQVIPPDVYPPYFENPNPANGATGVDVTSCVSVIIKDSESGVDSSTIVFEFDGEEVSHDDLSISELGVGSDWFSVQYCPPENLNYGGIYDVSVYAEDGWGNDETIEWSFTTEEAESLAEFTYNIRVLSISGSDTAATNLYLGLDNLGTDGYDSGLDVPQFLFPGAPRGYFPLMDPTHPEVPALSRDIRSTESGLKQWTVDVFEPEGDLFVTWDNSALPYAGQFHYAVVDRGTTPTSWVSMESYDETEFTSDQQVIIRFLPAFEDTMPPIVREISMEGTGTGGGGYDPTTPLCFEVIDYGTGVDPTSVTISVDYVDLTDEFTSTTLSNGYRYCYTPDPSWAPNTEFTVEVNAADNALPANEMDPEIWTFTTGPAGCSPEFELPITLAWGSTPESMETITFGTIEGASPGYDAGVDQIQPPPITDAGFYFTCDDDPPADKLIKDMRGPCDRPNIWQIAKRDPLGSPTVTVTWPTSPVFADTAWHLYYISLPLATPEPTAVDDSWTLMDVGDSIVYNANTDLLYIGLGFVGEELEIFNIEGDVMLYGADDHSGIRVYLDGGSFRTTNSSGFYSFANIPLGTHELTFWDPEDDYCPHPDEDSVVIVDCDIADTTITVPTYDMVPCDSRMIYGTGSLMGSPDDNIDIELYDSTGTTLLDWVNTATSPLGYYEFVGIIPGTYILIASHTGYRSVVETVTVALVDVNVDFNLSETTVMVCGTAMLDGVPAEGIEIDGPGVAVSGTTDSLGAYCVFANIGYGTICASYTGYAEACTTLEVPEDGLDDLDFDLETIPVEVTVSVDLGCEASDESGAEVTLSGVGMETTPASGNVTFDDVDHGWYSVEVVADYHKTAMVDSIYVSADTTISVSLCCLDPVTDLAAEGDSVARPASDPLAITLTWTEPDTDCCMPDSYRVYRSETPFIDVTAPGVTLIGSASYGTATFDDETVEDGVTYYYDVVVEYGCESYYSVLAGNVSATSVYTPDPADILVLDWDNGATPCNGGTMGVGEWWVDMLESTDLGLSAVVATTDDSESDPLDGYNLGDYMLVVVALGINDADNTELPSAALAKLEAYRATSGKKMIIEGPDFGADYNDEDLFDNLGLSFLDDGAADFNVDWFFGNADLMHSTVGHTFDYDDSSSADHFVDILSASGGLTNPVGWDQDTTFRTFFYNGPCQTIISAIYLGGIVDGTYPYVQYRAASGYLWKIGIPNTGIYEVDAKLPKDYALAGNYPNPFNPVTTIEFQLPKDSDVELAIYDITGKRVETLVSERLDGGVYNVTWNASSMPSGVYFARMVAGEFNATHKVMLIK